MLVSLAWADCAGSDSAGPSAALSVQPDSVVLDVGGSRQLSAVGQTGSVSWASTNTTVAEVVATTGFVTAKGPGTTVITATSSDRHASATVRVRAPAIVQLSSALVSFAATGNGASPAAQTIGITNAGEQPLNDLSLGAVQYGAGQPGGWLSATLSAASAPATVALQATTGTLAAGTYTATLPVTSQVAANAPQSIAVRFVVAAPPAIVATPASAAFSAFAAGPAPAAAAIAIGSGDGGALSGLQVAVTYTAGQPSGWLTATLSGTVTPASLTLQAAPGALPAGTYAATVRVFSSVQGVLPIDIPVTLDLAPPPSIDQPAIGLSPPTVTMTTTQGGSPAAAQVSVSNAGTGTLSGLSAAVSYPAGQATGWLSASVGSTVPGTLTIRASPGTLLPGSYTGTVTVSSTLSGVSPASVQVTFTVAGGTPIISLSPGTVNFASAQGSTPTNQVVLVTNSGQGTLSGLSAAVTYAAGQPTGWLTATISPTTAPANLTLHASAASIASGSYSATVTVASTVPGVASRTVTVNFSVWVSFAGQISPILNTKSCVDSGCHGTWTYTYTTSLVKAGDPAGSTLYQRITSTTSPMPPTASLATNPALSSSQVQTIYNWILQGAKQ